MNTRKLNKTQHGFTLVEIAIVLVIFGFLLAAILLPLQAQRDISKQLETESLLNNAKTALLGFAQSNGRLPCPATNNGSATFPDDFGSENPDGGGACTVSNGFLPGKTLGLQPIDENGFALDAWNNRIIYAVSNANTSAFTTVNAMNNSGLNTLEPNLSVCSNGTADPCPGASLIDNAIAVMYSTGPTGGLAAGGVDELENNDNDTTFVSHAPSATGATNGEFDHIVIWLSPYILYNAMIEAGQLH